MVTNQNRLSPYLGFLIIFINHKVIPFAIAHKISKCLKYIIRKLFNPGTPGYRNTYKKTFLVTYL